MHRGNAARFVVAFALIVVLKWWALLQPPVWDSAMGLFPAALTLAGSGFDLLGLLAMPGFLEGGPNHHGTSLVTLLTAGVLAVLGTGTTSLVVLHLLHFAGAALALVVLVDLSRPVFGERGAILLGVAALLHPIFSAQVGYLYMEMPLFLFAVLALRAWTRQRFWPAVVWAMLAYATKEPGLIVPGTLVVATLIEGRPIAEKVRRAGAIMALPVVWTVGVFGLRRLVASGTAGAGIVPALDDVVWGVGHYLDRFLLNVPDLLLLLTAFVVFGVVHARPVLEAMHREPMRGSDRSPEQERHIVLGYAGILIVLFVAMFTVVLPVAIGYTLTLPRYYVTILPFLLMWFGHGAGTLLDSRVRQPAVVCFAVVALLGLVNMNGVLYPSDVDTEGPGNDPPLTERSNAYRRLLSVQREAVRALEELPEGVPVYYGHFEHFLFQHPGTGYTSGPLRDGHNIWLDPIPEPFDLGEIPPCLYLLYNYPWLGGEEMLRLIAFAEARPELTFDVVREFRDGRYVITLGRVRHATSVCPT